MSRFRLFDLNPEQYRAATHPEGALLILAGAGTGKTRVLTARIAWLVSQGVDPSSILAVTFTNKAAREMRERITTILGAEKTKAMTLSTFHSLCVRLLRRDAPLLGYKENFSIMDESDQMGLIKKIAGRIHDSQDPINPEGARAMISKVKNLSASTSTMSTAVESLFTRYQQELRSLNTMDFDDLLLYARELLVDHEAVRLFWQQQYRYILIDEFQDTNKLQLDFMSQLVGKQVNLCVVGDDDQSIYGWRGAQRSNLLELERYFSNPEIIKLEQNYRSTHLILSAANRLIQHNAHRYEKNLWSDQKEGDPIRLLSSADDMTEAEFIADEIKALGSEKWDHSAILYRMNAQSRIFETMLRERKIPYRVVGGKSFFDRREIRDVMAYLTALLNPDDDNALLRVLAAPPRGIGKVTLQLLLETSIKQKSSLSSVILDPEQRHDCSTKTAEAIVRFAEDWGAYQIRLQTPGQDPAMLLDEILKECGYNEDLRKSCKTPEEADQRETNVRELLESMGDFCQKNRRNGAQQFLDTMSLEREKAEEKEERHGVTLITLHAAKGLEYEFVYLVGLEDGLLPHERSKEEGNIEEERRLCYVGMTRAKKKLTMTYCRTRKKYGTILSCTPSPFLLECAGEGVEETSIEEILTRPLEEADVNDAFASMRALLNLEE
ncbi:MAG: 3'-5' exonuclease [Verrucomicrobiae bacterium]|jgi:superfamily I DNA/RNA helicase|nr:3'-5' exonuclease [Verrucomicrobiae bacterium]